jgi:hypothetical protein
MYKLIFEMFIWDYNNFIKKNEINYDKKIKINKILNDKN